MSRYKKILVLLDLSASSRLVAEAAVEMAAGSNALIVALHVVEFVPIDPAGDAMLPSPPVELELMKHAEGGLAALIASMGAVNVKQRIEAGNTKAEILRVAEEESVDLIVLGSRERHGLAILVNFTEDTVLHEAHCDVLSVRLPDA